VGHESAATGETAADANNSTPTVKEATAKSLEKGGLGAIEPNVDGK